MYFFIFLLINDSQYFNFLTLYIFILQYIMNKYKYKIFKF